MTRFILILGLVFACGCGSSSNLPTQESIQADVAATSSEKVSAFRLDKTKNVIYMDTRVAPGQLCRFDIGLGSITIETLHAADEKLTFHYTPEIEGGYTTYECAVPVSPSPVEFRIESDGTPGSTSFDLSKCKVVRSGSFLDE